METAWPQFQPWIEPGYGRVALVFAFSHATYDVSSSDLAACDMTACVASSSEAVKSSPLSSRKRMPATKPIRLFLSTNGRLRTMRAVWRAAISTTPDEGEYAWYCRGRARAHSKSPASLKPALPP